MSWLKTAFVLALLAAIAFGVYISINHNPESTPPSGVADGWLSPPNVEVPGSPTSERLTPPLPGSPMGPSEFGQGSDATPLPTGQLPGFEQGTDPPSSFSSAGYPGSSGGYAGSPESGLDVPLPPDPAQSDDWQPGNIGSNDVRMAFASFMQAAHDELDQGNLAKVHETLNLWYANPQLTLEERRQITDLLDQVAWAVLYSPQHVLERAYVVKSGDTLQRIGRAYGVPWQLLAKINRIRQWDDVQPGRQLKVVRGPFDAVIHLDRHELTLIHNNLYAGRFRIEIGRGQPGLPGDYVVEDKFSQPGDANDLLGKYRIKLASQIGNQIEIHGTNDPPTVGTPGGPGSIGLADQDVEDVHDILSIGSRVQILR